MRNKFRAVEVGIFSIVSLVFLNSVYNLFTDGRLLGSGERKPLITQGAARSAAATTVASAVGGGTPSTSSGPDSMSGFVPYETKCQTSGELFETNAAKIRILGPFCGSPGRQIAGVGAGGEISLTDYKIENSTSHYTATVFSDHTTGKFSTDFIPLEPGTNKIVVEFRYKGGKVYPVELTIVRK